MLTQRMKKTIGVGVFALTPLVLPFMTAGVAQSHGFTTGPSSRQDACANGSMSDCGAIQWEPQSVEGPKGFPDAGPKDGTLCSGGNEPFSQLDEPREWPKTDVKAGQDFNFTWKITAAHSTSKWEYWITKDGWDPSKPLSRDQLEPAPFLTLPYDGKRPPNSFSHKGKLPEGKTGHHVIFSVWEIADTSNSFYACSDVNFG